LSTLVGGNGASGLHSIHDQIPRLPTVLLMTARTPTTKRYTM
jgi:hypothetical protein